MDFEFDPRKSKRNKQKHGIDSIEAQALWDDPDLLEIPVQTIDEPRYPAPVTEDEKLRSS